MANFTSTQEALHNFAEKSLNDAQKAGASSAAVHLSETVGQVVTVRLDAVETIAYNRDTLLSITAYVGQKKGSASTSDLSAKSIEETAQAAVAIAKYTANDPYTGLADPILFAKHFMDLDLYHPSELSVEEMVLMAQRMERRGIAVDNRINNSSGSSITQQQSQSLYANTLGFVGFEKETYYSANVELIAQEGENLQQNYWVDAARSFTDLETMEAIGKKAGIRTIQRLGARRIKTQQAPVLFEATVAGSLIHSWISAVSGASLYRRASFLLDSLNTAIFSPIVYINESPHIQRGWASRVFDAEGVATQSREMVTGGILKGYFLDNYAALKLGMQSTGNAGGPHNLEVKATHPDLNALLTEMGSGLLVTELMGHGVNIVTGDYSQGVAGFWVENGVIQYPVEQITIAGNLKDMFKQIVAIGADRLRYSSKQCGSILVDNMMIAGT